MKKIIYALIVSLVAVSGIVFTNHEIKNEPSKKSAPTAEKKTALKKWEATPDGLLYKQWEMSPAGLKVLSSTAKISKSIREYTNMQAIVTSLSLPEGARLGFGMMVKIDGDEYILSFGLEKPNSNEFQQLRNLKVNDKITIRSRSISNAPKYSYPILAGDFIEKDGKLIYKRTHHKDGC